MTSLRRKLGDLHWALRGWLTRTTDRLLNPLWLARRRLDQAVTGQAAHAVGTLLDIGCGAQPYRRLFPQVSRYIGLDVTPRPGAQLVGTALALPLADESCDTVLCCQVLEHVPEPQKLFAEANRVLRPGGTLILTTPQVWGLHLEPHDYFRFTRYGLSHLAQSAGLRAETVHPTCGLAATLTQRLADTLAHNRVTRRSRGLFLLVCALVAPMLLTGLALDTLLGPRGDTLDNLLLARKPRPQTQEQSTPPSGSANRPPVNPQLFSSETRPHAAAA